jgi:hypothetical protein
MLVKIIRVAAVVAIAGLGFGSGAAFGAPVISGCTDNGDDTQTCNLFETNSDGLPSETSSSITDIFAVDWTSGYWRILDPNETLSDIVVFPDSGVTAPSGVAGTAFLISCDDGALPGNCSIDATLLGTAFEDASGNATFLGNLNDTFNVFSPPEGTQTVPEPITLSLFGAGLAGAAALRRRKKKTA